ncbi:MAG: hypothetical protein AAFR61_28120 [Bacteroidota bacterium]
MRLILILLVSLLLGGPTLFGQPQQNRKLAKSHKPFLQPVPAQKVSPGQTLTIPLKATNEAGEGIIIEYTWQKDGQVDQQRQLFRWTPGEQDLGTFPIIFTAIDTLTGQQVSQPAIITVNPIRHAPQLSLVSTTDLTQPFVEVIEGEDFALVIEGRDKNEKEYLKLDYHVDQRPGKQLENASFQVNERVATFLWTPNNRDAQKKNFTLTFSAVDPTGLRATKVFYILVKDVKHGPIFQNNTREFVFGEGKQSSLTVKATDADGDEIRYGVQTQDIQEGDYFFDRATGKFQWKPGFDYAQQTKPYALVFSATDGQSTVFDTLRVRVSAKDYPPTIGSLRNKSIQENEMLVLKLDVQDKNGDENLKLILSDDGGVNGYQFDPQKREFKWKPPFSFVRKKGGQQVVQFSFRVSDGQSSASQSVQITVNDREDPDEVLQEYSQYVEAARRINQELNVLDGTLTDVIKRKRGWNTFFDVMTIVVGVFTGVASSNIASEGLRNASAPIGAAATSLIGIRNILGKSLDKIVNLKAQIVALNGKIQLTLNSLDRKYGEVPTQTMMERADFRAELNELNKKVESFEEEKVTIMAGYANLPIKKN